MKAKKKKFVSSTCNFSQQNKVKKFHINYPFLSCLTNLEFISPSVSLLHNLKAGFQEIAKLIE